MTAVTALFAALSLSAAQNPAMIVEWGATGAPVAAASGPQYCMLWAGRTRPMLNFSIYDNRPDRRPDLLIGATSLSWLPDREMVTVSVAFPNGAVHRTTGTYYAAQSMVAARMPSQDVVHLGLSAPGVVSVTIGRLERQETLRFQAPALASQIQTFRSCAARLGPASGG